MHCCPHCNAIYPELMKEVLHKCGFALAEQDFSNEQPKANCERFALCGKGTPVGEKQCRHCGTRLSETISSITELAVAA